MRLSRAAGVQAGPWPLAPSGWGTMPYSGQLSKSGALRGQSFLCWWASQWVSGKGEGHGAWWGWIWVRSSASLLDKSFQVAPFC